jgi:lysylphosphatidylglycerol synthetase-like protein (DUF2156 family)
MDDGWVCIVAGLVLLAFRLYIASDYATQVFRDAFPGQKRRLGVANLWLPVLLILMGIAAMLVQRLPGVSP